MNDAEKRILQSILESPTAPFQEHEVRNRLARLAMEAGLVVRQDRFGNLYTIYKKGRAKPIAFSGHMDHPGFEVLQGGKTAKASLLGGVRSSMQNAPVVFYRRQAGKTLRVSRGHIASSSRRKEAAGKRPSVTLRLQMESPVAIGDWGHFDFPGFRRRGELLYSKAIDNLVSCALIVLVQRRLARRKSPANVLGIHTRAEEVGFAGAGGVLRSRILARTCPTVVMEASQARYEVELGKGPVLRVGDRMSCFDPDLDLWMARRAALLQQSKRGFRFQRALMTGGACEASLFASHSRPVGALALPLGNYHNVRPDGEIGPEFVHWKDLEQELSLLEDLSLHPPQAGLRRNQKTNLDSIFLKWQKRLLAG